MSEQACALPMNKKSLSWNFDVFFFKVEMFKQFTILLFNMDFLTVRKQRDCKKERLNAECQSSFL